MFSISSEIWLGNFRCFLLPLINEILTASLTLTKTIYFGYSKEFLVRHVKCFKTIFFTSTYVNALRTKMVQMLQKMILYMSNQMIMSKN